MHELEHESGLHITHHDIHANEGHGEPWLISYADMMTLLFGFFVLMYSYAIADNKAKETIKKEISQSMGGKYENPYENASKKILEQIKKENVADQVSVELTPDGVRMTSKGTFFSNRVQPFLVPLRRSFLVESL